MKETFYFSHDFHARSDEKILKLLQKERWEGYGLYWAIVEKIYEAGGWIEKDYDTIAYDLRTEYERITRVIETYDLFIIKDGKISSKSILDRIALREEKSNKARDSVSKRWAKVSDKTDNSNTNVIRTYNDSNTIKERKGKEIKENKTEKNINKKKKKEETEKKDEKIEIISKVFLTIEEDKIVREKYGNYYNEAIGKLSNYINSKGAEYVSHYHVFNGWLYDDFKKRYPDIEKTEKEIELKIAQEKIEKEKKKKEEQEKIEAERRIKELEKYYNTLPKSLQEEITALAEKSFSHISDEARKKFPENYRNFVQGKRRSITEHYKNK